MLQWALGLLPLDTLVMITTRHRLFCGLFGAAHCCMLLLALKRMLCLAVV